MTGRLFYAQHPCPAPAGPQARQQTGLQIGAPREEALPTFSFSAPEARLLDGDAGAAAALGSLREESGMAVARAAPAAPGAASSLQTGGGSLRQGAVPISNAHDRVPLSGTHMDEVSGLLEACWRIAVSARL